MKWFKHMANARDDDFIEWLEENYGFEGYGRWWRILEIIAASMDKNCNDPSATHTWTKWQILLAGKRVFLVNFLTAISQRGKIQIEQNENVLKITCPNILKMRDEYSRKSGHTPKQVRSDSQLEAEAEKDKKESTYPLPLSSPVGNSQEKIPIPKYNLQPKKILNNDFDAAAAACCSLLYRRNLSPVDRTLLVGWCEKYDFLEIILPVLEKKTKSHATKNNGKPPATLSYFVDAISEATSRPRPPAPP